MFVNNFIYFYIGVCILLITFELAWGQYIKIYNIKIKKMKINYKEKILAFSRGLECNIDERELAKNLKNIDNLMAFQLAYEELSKRRDCTAYIYKILPVFIYINMYYAYRKSDMEKAYFAYVIGKDLALENVGDISIIYETLYEFLNNKSINCRVNAMNAICSIGKTHNIEKAVQIVSKSQSDFKSILLAASFKNFKGNKEELANELFKRFNNYKENVQIAIIMFLSENRCVSDEAVVEKLDLSLISVNVKCEILRYFQINKSDIAKSYLLKELNKESIKANDFTIKAIGTLGYYDDEDVYTLLEKLKHTNDEMILETVYRSIEKNQKNKSLTLV